MGGRSFAIIGAGRLGVALAAVLSGCGYDFIGIASRSLASAQKAVEIIGCGCAFYDICSLAKSVQIIFITTPDKEIASVCNQIASHGAFGKDSIVFHCSGSLPADILISARNCGAHIGSLHPIQSFAEVNQAIKLLPASFFGFEGDKAAQTAAREIAQAMNGKLLIIPTKDKALYHAAAVFASNYTVCLLDIGVGLLESLGIDKQDAYAALLSLFKGTLHNLERLGLPQALTGPIARGDTPTIANHLSILSDKYPQILEFYKRLGEQAVKIAEQQGGLSDKTVVELSDLLG